MSNRAVTLMATLLGVHRIAEPEAVLPYLLGGLAPAYGPAVAACYLMDGVSSDFRLEFVAATAGDLTVDGWERDLRAPACLPYAAAMPLINRLADAALGTLTGPVAPTLAGLWPAETSTRLQQSLKARTVAVAAVSSGQGPIGLVLLLPRGRWPREAAAEGAAHAAAALGRLIELRNPGEAIGQAATREIHRAQRYGRPLSLAVIELPERDRSPARQFATAALAARLMRESDTAGHLDQGRIAVLLPETDGEGTAGFLRRLRAEPASRVADLRGGYATFPADGSQYQDLIRTAIDRLALLVPADGAEMEAAAGPIVAEAGDAAADGDLATLRVRIAPLTEEESDDWRSLLSRLPAVVSVTPSDFDGFAGTFAVQAESVTRLLAGLHSLAGKIDATLSMTITGEVGLSLRTRTARTSSRTAAAPLRPLPEPGASRTPAATERDGPSRVDRAMLPRRHRSFRPGRLVAGLMAGAVVFTAVSVAALLAGDGTSSGEPAVSVAAPTAAAGAADQGELWIARDLTGGCLPSPGQVACDAWRAALWRGDVTAWKTWAALAGEPELPQAEVLGRAIVMRLEAGDPASRAELAGANGRPLPVIAAVALQEEGGVRRVSTVEVTNLGVAAADLSGATLPGFFGPLPAGSRLAPNERCIVGASAGDDRCAFVVDAEPDAGIAPGERLRLIGADGRELDGFAVP